MLAKVKSKVKSRMEILTVKVGLVIPVNRFYAVVLIHIRLLIITMTEHIMYSERHAEYFKQEFVRPRWPYDMRPSARAEKYMCVIVIR